jgi:hypothetical protein
VAAARSRPADPEKALFAGHRRPWRRRITRIAGLNAGQLLAIELCRGIARQTRFASHLVVEMPHRFRVMIG